MDILDLLDREGLQIASSAKRIAAFVIDDTIISLLLFFAFYDQIAALNGDIEAISNLMSSFLVYIIVLKIVYHTIFTSIYGASIGKIICKIKIVRLDTISQPNLAQSLLRSSVRTISEMLLYIPLIIAFGNPFKMALHDMLVKTIVIDVGVPQEVE